MQPAPCSAFHSLATRRNTGTFFTPSASHGSATTARLGFLIRTRRNQRDELKTSTLSLSTHTKACSLSQSAPTTEKSHHVYGRWCGRSTSMFPSFHALLKAECGGQLGALMRSYIAGHA